MQLQNNSLINLIERDRGVTTRRSAPRKHFFFPGQQFKYFTLERELGRIKIGGRSHVNWLCLCQCGREFTSTVKNLIRGKVACGQCGISYGGLKGRYKNNDPTLALYKSKYRAYKNGAKNRELDFFLIEEEAYQLFKSNCFYCNIEPCLSLFPFTKHDSERPVVYANGIDRIDSNRGYVVDNVVPCCHICNRAKSDMNQQEFLKWIQELRSKMHAQD
jgi:hypothetical protein